MYSYDSLKQFIDVLRDYLDYDSEFFVTLLRIIFSCSSALKQSLDSVNKSQWCYKTLRHCGYHHIQGKFPSYMYVYWLLLFLKRHCLNISIHAITSLDQQFYEKIKIVYRGSRTHSHLFQNQIHKKK